MPQSPTILLFIATLLLAACGGDEPVEPGPSQTQQAEPDMSVSAGGPICEDGPGEVYERRIRPLLENDRPSSCSKCHAAGVHLSEFVTGDPCGSMACLVEQGMVDLERPRQSKLLEFIERGYEPAEDTGVTDVMVAREYTGFLEWIEWSAACLEQCPPTEGSLACPAPETPLVDDEEEPEVEPIPELTLENYPCTEDDQARAFKDWAFPAQSRCGHCHAVNGAIGGIADAPMWIAHKPTLLGAKRTISNLYNLGAIDHRFPEKSHVLLKPLHEDAGGIDHGGGGKFLDQTDELYVSLLQWIRMQAHCNLTRAEPSPEWATDDKLHTRYPEVPYVQ